MSSTAKTVSGELAALTATAANKTEGPGRLLKIAIPLAVGIVLLAIWEFCVYYFEIRQFVLPAPSQIAVSLVENFVSLSGSLWFTMKITLLAFLLAITGGIALAIVFSQSRTAEMALFPYAVVLQVTPVVAIAPLIIIWVGIEHAERAVLILAWIVAFFPMLSNTTLGLKSTDHNLRNLFELYGATRWQKLAYLQLPNALPYILAGMKISGGLALIGAIVAEFVAGSGGATGLAWRISEAGYRLQIPKMFAALIMLSLMGIAIFFLLSALEHYLLRHWHESATRREN
jgi:NitT/TauT family transport system permease protein